MTSIAPAQPFGNKRPLARNIAVLAIMCAVVPVVMLLALGTGSMRISPPEVLRALFIDDQTLARQIIWNIRFPRVLVAALVGMSLALSGAILQGVLRNPLAAPNIIGVSSGAGFAGFLILIVFPEYSRLVPAGAFAGSLGATLAVYSLAWKGGAHPFRLILAGVAVSSLLGAGMSTLMIFYPERVQGVLTFMVGGLSARSWPHFNIIWPYATTAFVVAAFLPTRLNILTLGDDVATGLGLQVERTRLVLIAVAALLAASAVSVVGLLGFVGLIVPHIARKLVGPDNRILFPASLACGASIVVLCDTIGRTVLDPVELPVGIIMALIGAPFFLFLLRERKMHA
jgi:iron complex transport system permease protein